MWRLAYRADRYMRSQSDLELEERIRVIMTNQLLLTEAGQIGIHRMEEGGVGQYWMVMWTHALEEMRLRHGAFPGGFTNGFVKEAQLVKPSYPSPSKAKIAIDAIGGPRAGCLYKFGKAIHLTKAHTHGIFRIAPASMYNDPSLNKAIRDDELSLKLTMRGGSVTIYGRDSPPVMPFGNVEFNFASKTNYFVLCFSSMYTYREYDDFEADSCLVVREPRTLIRNLMKAVRKRLPGWRGFACQVTYVDPLNADPSQVDITTCKHFRYSYQHEYRAIWIPNFPHTHLEPFEVDIGRTSTYARLISIH
jgi:hypothetical protein